MVEPCKESARVCVCACVRVVVLVTGDGESVMCVCVFTCRVCVTCAGLRTNAVNHVTSLTYTCCRCKTEGSHSKKGQVTLETTCVGLLYRNQYNRQSYLAVFSENMYVSYWLASEINAPIAVSVRHGDVAEAPAKLFPPVM